ncbi:MAG TPA: choice-of-anchor Q domain-containing protein, partial [Candidatus Hydrogenedentes bacterium]|nr:choice-of-anchor Q domain-containing protein [Candidatus Hydrogenedentota bacterium]
AGAHGSISGDSPQTVDYGGSGTAVTAVPDDGYIFKLWSDGSTENPRTDINVTTDVTVTAWFGTGWIMYVVPDGTGDGSSWASPFGSLQAAMDFAMPGDEVWVAAGTYTATTDPVVTMKVGVSIYGGFAGTETARDERDWTANVTVIDGENARRCVLGANNATLDGFTITHGSAIGSNGGGMLNNRVSPSVSNCIFIANVSQRDDEYNGGIGGGMYNSGDSPSVNNCTFTRNSASEGGGGMYNSGSSPSVTNCTFMGNSARYNGGGMHNGGSSSSVSNCTFMGNTSDHNGGGMYNSGDSPSVTNCTFMGNTARYNGGGMYNYSSSPVVTNCTFTDNSAREDGGGMYNRDGSPIITNCAFMGNSARYNGGGMYNSGDSTSVSNCTFMGNSADSGGGMYNSGSSPSVTNCTFMGNSARYNGGGMYNYWGDLPNVTNCTFTGNSADLGGGMYNGYKATPSVTNCILWGDSSEIYNDTNLPFVTYSCVQGGAVYEGDGNINTDPLFVNAAAGSVQLQAGSPCVGAGTATGAPATDILGRPRPIGTGVVTMGAYEGTVDLGALVDLTIAVSPVGCDATTTPPEGTYTCAPGDYIFISTQRTASMHFLNWTSSISGVLGTQLSVMVVMGIADETVTANFAINQYTLTYTAGAHGSISGDSPQTVDYGGSGTIVTAVPDDGYIFKLWSDGSMDNPRTDINVTTNVTVTAWFGTGWIVYVVPDGTGDGSSWASPLGSLQAAMDFSVAGDEVWVAAGMYTAMTDPVVTMKEGVALYGGFTGTEAVRDERDWTANVTMIDGENARRCVVGADNATLDGFTIMRGCAGLNSGSGMLNVGVSPNVSNCIFIENASQMDDEYNGSGGGMCNYYYAAPVVTNCTFTGNSANERGGGMCNYNYAAPVVTNCTFTGNSATEGGGMYNYNYAAPLLTNCILWGNSSEFYNEEDSSASVMYSCVQGDPVYPGTGNINTDPLFVGAPEDLHLQDGSPCIDTGTSEGAPATDIEGVARPQGGGFDMGAYER